MREIKNVKGNRLGGGDGLREGGWGEIFWGRRKNIKRNRLGGGDGLREGCWGEIF